MLSPKDGDSTPSVPATDLEPTGTELSRVTAQPCEYTLVESVATGPDFANNQQLGGVIATHIYMADTTCSALGEFGTTLQLPHPTTSLH